MSFLDVFKQMAPINNKVIAEVIEKEEKVLASGIVLTGEAVNQAMEDMRQARVISADSQILKPGDTVYYLRFVGTPIGDTIIILDEKDILGYSE